MKNTIRYTFLTVLIGLGWRLQAASTIQFGSPSYTVAESAGAVTLTVQRTGDTNTAVSVDYATADGTATNGFNYTAVAGTLAFGPGETNQIIVVPILNEGFVDGTRVFRVDLSNPTNAVLGTPTYAVVLITDNDVGIDFQFASYSVAEDAGAVMIGVVRGDDGTLSVTVAFATSDLSATNGLDYAGTNTTLSFAPPGTTQVCFRPHPQQHSQTAEQGLSPDFGQCGRRHAGSSTVRHRHDC